MWGELRRSKSGSVSLLLVALVLVAATIGASLVRDAAFQQDLSLRLLPPGSEGHLLGTDGVGRDVLARAVYAARTSVIVGVVPVILSAIAGTTLGLIAGYVGGWVDKVIMRLVDLQIAFPLLLIALVINGVMGIGMVNLVIALTISGWANFARIIRGLTLSLKEQEFIDAARGLGGGPVRLLVRHILPNTASTLLVVASLQVAVMILVETAVSFLGFGIQPPTPSWGNMLSDAQIYLFSSPWLVIVPGMFLVLTVLGVNLLGDFVRDVLDPRLKTG